MTFKQKASHAVASRTLWREIEEEELDGRIIQTLARVHVPSHGFCLVVYAFSLAAYTVYAVYMFYTTPKVETFSSAEVSKFGTTSLNIEVDCPLCVIHQNGARWKVIANYPSSTFPHCGQEAPLVMSDQVSVDVPLCRTTDDIDDKTGVRIWIGNVTKKEKQAVNRTHVTISAGSGDTDLKVTTPLQIWHEKTLLLGLTVHRSSEECEESACLDRKQLYLASMQYDGHVDWGGETWAGAQLNIRLLKFAQIYTVVSSETEADVIASIGGASGILILVLGILRKILEAIHVRGFKGGVTTAAQESKPAVAGEVFGHQA